MSWCQAPTPGAEPKAPSGFEADGTDRATRAGYNQSRRSPASPCPPTSPNGAAPGRSAARCRATRYMTLGEARRLAAGVLWGAEIWQSWVGATINLDMPASPASPAEVIRALVERIRHWQAPRGIPEFYCWVRETGAQLGGHVHLVIASRAGASRALRQALCRRMTGAAIGGDAAGDTLLIRATTPAGWLGYAVKNLAPADAQQFRVETGISVAIEPPAAPVVGPRIGIARAMAPKARNQHRSQLRPSAAPDKVCQLADTRQTPELRR